MIHLQLAKLDVVLSIRRRRASTQRFEKSHLFTLSRQPSSFHHLFQMLSTVQNPRFLLRQCRHFPPKRRRFHSSTPLFLSQPQTLASTDPPSSPPQSQILTIRDNLLNRRTTAVELAQLSLNRLRLTEPQINSFISVSETVLREAEEIDAKIARNEELGPLAGVFVGVKDNICTADMPSTGGSRILENYRPPFDATAVKRVKDCGGIVVGKTNLDEFGMGSTTEGSAFQVSCLWFISFTANFFSFQCGFIHGLQFD